MTKKSSTSTKKRVHIISRKDGWAVKKEGTKRASKIYKKKDSAVKGAEKLKKSGHDVVVHKKDGTIQKWEKAKK